MLAPQLTNAHASATRAHHRASSAPLCTSQPRKLPPRAANCRRCLQNELCESSLELCRLDGLMARARMRYTLGRPRITSVVRIDKRSRGIVTLRKLTRRSTDYSLLCTHCRLCKLGNNDCKHMFQTRASLLTGLRASAREIVPTPGTRARRAGEPVSWPVSGLRSRNARRARARAAAGRTRQRRRGAARAAASGAGASQAGRGGGPGDFAI